MASEVPGVEHRDTQYFGYYAQLQHQVSFSKRERKKKREFLTLFFLTLAKHVARYGSYIYLSIFDSFERT